MAAYKGSLSIAAGGFFVPYACRVVSRFLVPGNLDLNPDVSLGGALWLALPFLMLAGMFLLVPVFSHPELTGVDHVRSLRRAVLGGFLTVTVWYLLAHMASERALQSHHWTAATLATAFLPLTSIPAFAVGVIVGWLAGRHPQHIPSPREVPPSS